MHGGIIRSTSSFYFLKCRFDKGRHFLLVEKPDFYSQIIPMSQPRIKVKKVAIATVKILTVVLLPLLALIYFFQERLIFFPQKLNKDYQFRFDQAFKEMSFGMKDGTLLNGLLFKADSSKGLIFYLHGNAGSLASWGSVAKVYTDLHYDVFMLDYRAMVKVREAFVTNSNCLMTIRLFIIR